ncbi:phage tail family protein [Lysinibacillus xylanilyticus]|uniref:phage tail domain-containing protein n=1 Tax=Lysinibacillus xylanilyticus TaxID=582475 RepID=UPI002B24C804|nr:phage tail domain-containing protein [Lysinibacillus xylanilyticus]MEB2279659.1 phage tail family protein [Lysinibacillus xylanilyticus]
MDAKLVKVDGSEIILSRERFITQDIIVSPIEIKRDVADVERRAGAVNELIKHGTRRIQLHLIFIAKDHSDFTILRDRAFDLFTDLEPYHLYEAIPTKQSTMYEFELPGKEWGRELDFMPSEVAFLHGKRYFVINSEMSEVEQKGLTGRFTVELETYLLPYGESSATLKELKLWDINKWQWNQGLTWADDLQYKFSSNNFTLKNLGNVKVDPRESELKITIKTAVSSYLEIKNVTTGEVFRFNGALSTTDTLILNGIHTYKNGANAILNTNKKLLTLAPGNNVFAVSGGTIQSIEFDFRFLYK